MLAPNPHDPFAGLPRGHYACIAADCATKFNAYSAKGETSRSPQKKYTTMADDELAALPLIEVVARSAFLFYWDTTARVAAGMHIPIMRAWGFKPTAFAFTWIKLRPCEPDSPFLYPRDSFNFGPGLTTRKGTEVCILGRRGSPKKLSNSVRELIVAPRREHSRKPDEFYDRVRAYCAGPRLELFSRTVRPGWDYALSDQLGAFENVSRETSVHA